MNDDLTESRQAASIPPDHVVVPREPDLTDPNVVHVNMLRGTIAKPSAEQIAHIYAGHVVVGTFQERVAPWMQECFGPEISADRIERNHRFLEEALELVQANGCTEQEAGELVAYVYGRDQGEINQEVGGVMVTLAALCLASGLNMHAAGETELARVWTKVEQIRAKQAAKPRNSPLPQHPSSGERRAPALGDDAEREERECTCGAGHGSLEGHLDWCAWVEASSGERRAPASPEARIPSDWQPMATAPHDRPITLCAGGMVFRAEWTCGFEAEDGMTCTWVATEEGKHPESWDDGVCWAINSGLVPSDQPEAWREGRRRWLKTRRLSGPTTRSIRGSAARRSRPVAITATPRR